MSDAIKSQAPVAAQACEHPGLDRAADYADGLFETIAFHRGHAPFWEWHMQRLQRDAARLLLQLPMPAELLQQANALAAGKDCVLRLTVSRAHGQGYWPLLDVNDGQQCLSSCKLHWQRRVMPSPKRGGVQVAIANLQLASQPLLAGIKHLARLEQVLAATEAQRRKLDELLLCDQGGFLVEAISSNVLVYLDRQWLTPELDDCGVSGVLRAWLLARGLISEARLHRSELDRATALALCNSVRGIQRVSVYAGRPLLDEAAVKLLDAAVSKHILVCT